METNDLIEKLRTESLYIDKATLEIMDLCMEAAEQLEAKDRQIAELRDKLAERETLAAACIECITPLEDENERLLEQVEVLTAKAQECEKAIADGLMIMLPCKVGDTVYLSTIGKHMIIKGYSLLRCTDFGSLCYHCRCSEHDKTNRKGKRNVINVCPGCACGEKCFQGFRLSDFGKTVFLTREEAEKGGRE